MVDKSPFIFSAIMVTCFVLFLNLAVAFFDTFVKNDYDEFPPKIISDIENLVEWYMKHVNIGWVFFGGFMLNIFLTLYFWNYDPPTPAGMPDYYELLLIKSNIERKQKTGNQSSLTETEQFTVIKEEESSIEVEKEHEIVELVRSPELEEYNEMLEKARIIFTEKIVEPTNPFEIEPSEEVIAEDRSSELEQEIDEFFDASLPPDAEDPKDMMEEDNI